jgi:hypothetical protein
VCRQHPHGADFEGGSIFSINLFLPPKSGSTTSFELYECRQHPHGADFEGGSIFGSKPNMQQEWTTKHTFSPKSAKFDDGGGGGVLLHAAAAPVRPRRPPDQPAGAISLRRMPSLRIITDMCLQSTSVAVLVAFAPNIETVSRLIFTSPHGLRRIRPVEAGAALDSSAQAVPLPHNT